MGRDEENKDSLKMYHPDHLYSWVNKSQTEFRIYSRLTTELLWSGSNLKSAEAWLSRHLIPSAMPKSRLSLAIADAFRTDSKK